MRRGLQLSEGTPSNERQDRRFRVRRDRQRPSARSSATAVRELPCSSRWEGYRRCRYPPAAFTPSSTVLQGWLRRAPRHLFVASEMDDGCTIGTCRPPPEAQGTTRFAHRISTIVPKPGYASACARRYASTADVSRSSVSSPSAAISGPVTWSPGRNAGSRSARIGTSSAASVECAGTSTRRIARVRRFDGQPVTCAGDAHALGVEHPAGHARRRRP